LHSIRDWLKNHEYILAILDYLLMASSIRYKSTYFRANSAIKKVLDYIRKNKLPTSLSQLDLNGSDLQKYFPALRKEKYSKILNHLFHSVLKKDVLNKKSELLNFLSNRCTNT
jgi:hypothetical protein